MTDQPPLPAVMTLPTLPLPQLPPMDSTADAPHASFPHVLEPAPPPHATKTPSPPTTHRREHRLLCSATASSISTLSPSVQHPQLSSTPQEAPNKRAQPEQHDYHLSPSPKKPAPNFNITPSDNDSIFSSDDVGAWEKEEDKMMVIISEQNRKEREEAEKENTTWLRKKDVKPTCLKHLRFHLHAIV